LTVGGETVARSAGDYRRTCVRMRLATWAKRQGIAYCTAWRWVRQDRMPIPWSKTPSGTIFVETGTAPERGAGAVALYARVSSNDQKNDLERQLGRLTEYATRNGMSVVKSVSGIGSGLNGRLVGRWLLSMLLKCTTISSKT
jgi:putative resolvase